MSASHLFLIFMIVLLVFGAKRLPEIARAMGKAVNEFKKAKDEVADSVDPEKTGAKTEASVQKPAEKPAEDASKKPS